MCTEGNAAICFTSHADLQGFYSFTESCRSAECSVCGPVLPAISLDMRFVYDRILDFFRGRSGSRGLSPFCNQYDFHGFQPLIQTDGSAGVSIFRPVKPAVGLRMHRIIYIILFCQFSGQTYLQSLQSFGLSCGSDFCSVALPVRPAHFLNERTILYVSVHCTVHIDLHAFHTFALSGGSFFFSVFDFLDPTVGLHMCLVADRCTFCRNCDFFLRVLCFRRLSFFPCLVSVLVLCKLCAGRL